MASVKSLLNTGNSGMNIFPETAKLSPSDTSNLFDAGIRCTVRVTEPVLGRMVALWIVTSSKAT